MKNFTFILFVTEDIEQCEVIELIGSLPNTRPVLKASKRRLEFRIRSFVYTYLTKQRKHIYDVDTNKSILTISGRNVTYRYATYSF